MDIKGTLETRLQEAMQKAMADGVFQVAGTIEIKLEEPPDKQFGDFATNLAMQLTRMAKKPPRVIAEALISRLDGQGWLEKAEIAGPGFINFYLKPTWLYDTLKNIMAQGQQYGHTDSGQGEKVQVEFVSANPTGPLHVGHGRGAAVGSALSNLLAMAGYNVQKEFYINDAGNQIDNLAASVDARYRELLGQQVKFPDDGYHGQDIIETAKALIAKDGDKYLRLEEVERLSQLKEIALAEKLAGLKKDLEDFGVTYDVWYSERTLHQNGAIEKVCAELKERGYLYDKDGALWLKSSAFGDDKDRVVIRDNGIPTYLAADIAYHRDKFARGFERVINLWGADHHGYIQRMKAAVGSLGYQTSQLEVVILQMVSLYRDGQVVKMSKRTGQGVTLAELIEEVGRDAARFFFIMRSTDSQLDFDIDLAKSQSNDNPVYYIQYAHARICSILRQCAEAGITLNGTDTLDFSSLIQEVEISLIRQLYIFPEEVAAAAKDRAPHRIARYAQDLAGLFHSFYNSCRVLPAEEPLRQARLALVTASGIVLRNALSIIGIDAPERM